LAGIIYALLVFTRDDSYPIDKILDSFSLFAIAIQVFSANISLKYGLPRNNWKQHRIYFFTKLLYCLTHLLEHTIKDSVICTYNLLSANCGRAFKYQLIAVIFWFMIELYFTMVVYHFYKNTRKGEYGPIGTSPSFLSTSPAIILMQRGITIEVRGLNIERTSPNEAQRLTILSSKPLYQNKLVINETEALIVHRYYLMILIARLLRINSLKKI